MPHRILLAALAGISLCACAEENAGTPRVEKGETALEDVPAAVIALAEAANEGGTLSEAEYEIKNGREIYDIGGVTAGGEEIEFDIGRSEGGAWEILETQRDIATSALPAAVAAELASGNGDLAVTRIIEGTLPDGRVVYEIYGTRPDGEETQIEIMVENGEVRTLDDLLPY